MFGLVLAALGFPWLARRFRLIVVAATAALQFAVCSSSPFDDGAADYGATSRRSSKKLCEKLKRIKGILSILEAYKIFCRSAIERGVARLRVFSD